jgi:hypothetical protein
VEWPSATISIPEPSIGAPVSATVQFSQNSLRRLVDVNYNIDGGAIATQTWTTTTGDYVPTQGIDHPLNPPQISDQWNWCWNEKVEQKWVTVNATDDLGDQFSFPFGPFNTTAPTPSNYVITAAPSQIGTVNGQWGLLSSAGGAQGVHYSALITMPGYGGTGGFVQLVNEQKTVQGMLPVNGQYTQPFTRTTDFPPSLFALDVPRNDGIVYFGGSPAYWVTLAPNSPTQVGGYQHPNGWRPTDAPGDFIDVPNGTRALTTSVTFTFDFKTYLDYQPLGGIHVEIAEIDWSITATAQYQGPPYPMTQAQYQSPSNWAVMAPAPSVGAPS